MKKIQAVLVIAWALSMVLIGTQPGFSSPAKSASPENPAAGAQGDQQHGAATDCAMSSDKGAGGSSDTHSSDGAIDPKGNQSGSVNPGEKSGEKSGLSAGGPASGQSRSSDQSATKEIQPCPPTGQGAAPKAPATDVPSGSDGK